MTNQDFIHTKEFNSLSDYTVFKKRAFGCPKIINLYKCVYYYNLRNELCIRGLTFLQEEVDLPVLSIDNDLIYTAKKVFKEKERILNSKVVDLSEIQQSKIGGMISDDGGVKEEGPFFIKESKDLKDESVQELFLEALKITNPKDFEIEEIKMEPENLQTINSQPKLKKRRGRKRKVDLAEKVELSEVFNFSEEKNNVNVNFSEEKSNVNVKFSEEKSNVNAKFSEEKNKEILGTVKRGRKKKVDLSEPPELSEKIPKKRGRKKKVDISKTSEMSEKIPKKRGRRSNINQLEESRKKSETKSQSSDDLTFNPQNLKLSDSKMPKKRKTVFKPPKPKKSILLADKEATNANTDKLSNKSINIRKRKKSVVYKFKK